MNDETLNAAKNPSLFIRILKMKTVWLLLPILGIAACSNLIQFEDGFESNDRIKRNSVVANSGIRDFNLSYLINPNPGKRRIIFVHGTPGSASGWNQYLYNAPEDLEFIAVDRPGFGETKPKRAVVSLDEQAEVLLPLLDAPDGKKPILIGHSLGGPVVAALAANYPDKVGATIQLASALDPGQEEVLFIQYVGNTPPISWLLPKAASNSNKELIWLEGELEALATKLDRIDQPVTIIHATDDELVPYANVPYMQKTLVNAKPLDLVTLGDGKNHFLPWNSEATVMKEIRRLVNRLEGNPDAAIVDETEEWMSYSDSTKGTPPGKIFKEFK
jgi:pimeloyl-ACP methyl ester carboxylesterase